MTKMKEQTYFIIIWWLEKLKLFPWSFFILSFIFMEIICIRYVHFERIYLHYHQFMSMSLFIQPVLINTYYTYKAQF